MVRLEIYRLDPILQLTVCAFPSPISCRPHVRHPRSTTVGTLARTCSSFTAARCLHLRSTSSFHRLPKPVQVQIMLVVRGQEHSQCLPYPASTLKDQFRQGQVRHQTSSLAGR